MNREYRAVTPGGRGKSSFMQHWFCQAVLEASRHWLRRLGFGPGVAAAQPSVENRRAGGNEGVGVLAWRRAGMPPEALAKAGGEVVVFVEDSAAQPHAGTVAPEWRQKTACSACSVFNGLLKKTFDEPMGRDYHTSRRTGLGATECSSDFR